MNLDLNYIGIILYYIIYYMILIYFVGIIIVVVIIVWWFKDMGVLKDAFFMGLLWPFALLIGHQQLNT